MFTEKTRYPLDNTGINSDNYISGELHTLSTVDIRTVAPIYGSFFSESLIIYDHILNNLLVKNIDYKLAELDQEATLKYGKEIYKLIVIINPLVTDIVRIYYNALGSKKQQDLHGTIELYNQLINDDRVITYDNILGKPSTFTPSLHKHLLTDIIDFNPLVTSLERVRKAMVLKDIPTLQTIANWIKIKYGDNSYSIYASSNNVNRGASINVNLLTDILPDNTTLYWTIEHITTNAADFVATNGTINIINNSGIFIVSIPSAAALTDSERFKINIREISITGDILISSQEISINGVFSLVSVNTPIISSPINNSVTQNVNVAFTSSAFAMTGASDSHQGSDWQVATDLAFTNIVHQVTNSFTNKTSWTHPDLGYATIYYLRVRYKGTVYGYSNWSNTIKFTTKLSGTVNTPTLVSITPSNTSINPTINTSVLALSEGTDVHLSTDWEIATDSIFSNKVRTSVNDTVNKTAWTPSPNLSNSITYYLRFRYKAEIAGYSNWSATTVINTAIPAMVNAPVINSVMDSWDSLSRPLVTIGTTAFSVSGGTDTHLSSDWQISTNSIFSSIVAQSLNDTVNKTTWLSSAPLAFNQAYWIRVRHKGAVTGLSAWAVSSYISVSPYTVNKPIITIPVSNLTIYPSFNVTYDAVGITKTIRGNTFGIIGGNGIGNHTDTFFEISELPDFSLIRVSGSKLALPPLPTEFTDQFIQGGAGAIIYIRMRYKDGNVGYSQWSDTRIITIPALTDPGNPLPVITEPVITSPTNTSLIGKTSVVTASAFTQSPGIAATHLSSDWQVSTNPAFTAIVEQSINDTVNKTSWVMGNSISLTVATNYYIRVRYKGSNGTYSSWSNTIQVTTKSIFAPILEAVKLLHPPSIVGSFFGYETDIDSEGNRIVISAYGEPIDGIDDIGAVYIYNKSGATWVQEAKLTASDKAAADQFGWSVAMDGLGNRIIASANRRDSGGLSDSGAVYIFRRDGVTWVQEQILTASDITAGDMFGQSVDMNYLGDRIIISSILNTVASISISGAAYIFTRVGTTWVQEQILTASDKSINDAFGWSVAMTGLGDRVIISTRAKGANTGAAYIFRRDAGPLWVEEKIITASNAALTDFFGQSVDITYNGDRVVIGANLKDTDGIIDSGAAYVYSRIGTTWVEEAYIKSTVIHAFDSFGFDVSINDSGNMIIVGSPGDETPLFNAGSAYIYSRSGTTWNISNRLLPSDPFIFGLFGSAVNINNSGIATISTFSFLGTISGSVYIFV